MNADEEREGGEGGEGADEAKSGGQVEHPEAGGNGNRKPLENDPAKAKDENIKGEEKEGKIGDEEVPNDGDSAGDSKVNEENDGSAENDIDEEGGAKTNGDNGEGKQDDFKSVANKTVVSESSSDSEDDDASPIPSPPPSAAEQHKTPVTPATDDPNFAVVCAFLDKFGAKCNLECPSIGRLQEMLEASHRDVKQELITFQCRLLRKLNKSITTSKWEKALTKFAFTYSADDGWELERFGYKGAKMGLKVRLIKNLMEAQFDVNPKFKSEVNNLKSSELRSMPLGTDKMGNNYWYQLDAETNLRIYKEDVDEETWELVAQNKAEFEELLRQLKEGSTYVKKTDEANGKVEVEDEESMQEFANIIRDTGPVPKEESVENSVANSKAPSAYNTDDEASNQASTVGEKGAKEESDKNGVENDLRKPEKHDDKDVKLKGNVPAHPKFSNADQSVKKESSPSESSEKEPSRPKHSFGIANLIGDVKTPSKEEVAPQKRDLEEKQSPLDEKKMRADPSKSPSKEQSDPPVFVSGSGSGRDNESAPIPEDEITEEVVFFFGEGLGADCCTGNTNGNGDSTEVEGKQNGESASAAEKDSKVGRTLNSKDLPIKDTADKPNKEKNGDGEKEESDLEGEGKTTPSDEEDETEKGKKCDEKDEDDHVGENGEDASTDNKSTKAMRKSSDEKDGCSHEENKDVSRRNKRKKEEEKAPSEKGDSDDDGDSKAKRRKREKREKKASKAAEEEEEDEQPLRRRSSRVQALQIMEAERRQKDEQRAPQEYKEKQKRKEEREKKRMAKYRRLGLNYEAEMRRKKAKKEKKKAKRAKEEDEDYEDEEEAGGEEVGETKKRRRKKKKKQKRGEEHMRQFAKFSSGSSSDDAGLEGESDDEDLHHLDMEEDMDEINANRSDHEFSCESDVPEEEWQPIKHARTATKKGRKRRKKVVEVEEEEEEEEEEEFKCKKCDKSDHPEFILLCDTEGCEAGWHNSCLRPALMVIPEGEWFCPDCMHANLIKRLEEKMEEYAPLEAKKDAKSEKEIKDQKRRERLAFVSLSLSNILPEREKKPRKVNPPSDRAREKRRRQRRPRSDSESFSSDESSSSESSSSCSESEEAEGNYATSSRRRAARKVTYNTQEYDDMIKEAIADSVTSWTVTPAAGGTEGTRGKGKDIGGGEEVAEEEEEEKEKPIEKSVTGVSGVGRGKDMSNILGAEEDEDDEEDKGDGSDKETPDPDKAGEEADPSAPQPLKMVINKDAGADVKGGKGKGKKRKKMTDLSDSDDGDGDSGSDFELSDVDAAAVEESEEVSAEDLTGHRIFFLLDHILVYGCRKRNSLTMSSKSRAMRSLSAEEESEAGAMTWNQRGDLAEIERYC